MLSLEADAACQPRSKLQSLPKSASNCRPRVTQYLHVASDLGSAPTLIKLTGYFWRTNILLGNPVHFHVGSRVGRWLHRNPFQVSTSNFGHLQGMCRLIRGSPRRISLKSASPWAKLQAEPRLQAPTSEVGTQEFRARSQGALDPWGDQTLRQPCSHMWYYSRSLEPALGMVHVHVVQYNPCFLQVCMFPPLAETHISYLTRFVQKKTSLATAPTGGCCANVHKASHQNLCFGWRKSRHLVGKSLLLNFSVCSWKVEKTTNMTRGNKKRRSHRNAAFAEKAEQKGPKAGSRYTASMYHVTRMLKEGFARQFCQPIA